MKASTALKKATELREKSDMLLKPITDAFIEILDDDSAHVTYQSGDGWCLCYSDGHFSNNALLSSSQVDELIKMDKAALLAALELLGI